MENCQVRESESSKIEKYTLKGILFFLSVYVLINPFSHTTSIKEICFYGSVLLLVVAYVAGKRDFLQFKTPLRVSTVLFVVWVLVGFFFALDKQNTIHDIYSHLFRYIILYILFVNFFDTRKKIVILSWLIIFSIVSFVLFSLFKFYIVNGNNIQAKFFGNSQGMTYNLISIPIIFTAFLACCNGATANKIYYKAFFLLLLIPLVCALVLTQARSAFLVLAVSSLFFMFSYKRKLIPVILIVFACILVFTPLKNRFNRDIFTNLRLDHGLLVLEVLNDSPLTGIGFGMETFGYSLDLDSYKKKLEEKYSIKYGQEVVLIDPHNMYTDILVRTGLPGFALYMFFVFSLFRMLWKIRMSGDICLRVWSLGITSSLAAFYTIGFFEPVFSHVHEFNFVLMVSLSSMLWKQYRSGVAETREICGKLLFKD